VLVGVEVVVQIGFVVVDVLVVVEVRHLLVFKEMLSHCIRIRCFTKFGDTFLNDGFNFFVKFSSVRRC
ncbi:hypothetical protein A2U01_0070585, partial [Trifolium medium]|nr:hypothetical protein [Trifolium medium]